MMSEIHDALRAVEYANRILLRRTAGEISPEDAASLHDPNKPVHIPPDAPNEDWQQRYKHDDKLLKWHPPYGESHIKYHVYPLGGGKNRVVWRANHHGLYQGMETLSAPNGNGADITFPNYQKSGDPDPLGSFKNPAQAKAAAEDHYRQNYPKAKHDYDLDQMMGKGRPEDGEDYSRIFGMTRQALRYAQTVMSRNAKNSAQIKLAREMSPPCPDCGQVAGWGEHMVHPSVKECNNCGWTMLDHGIDSLLHDTLNEHDMEIDALPETDHPTLGRHGQRSPRQ